MDTAIQPKERYFKRILLFTIPIMLSGLLQTLYSAADLIVVGQFEGNVATAAVGSTGPLNNLILGLFMGLSAGSGVCVAHEFGAKRMDELRKTVHTSVALAIILGIFVGVVGFFICPTLLRLMDTPDDVINESSLYLQIIMLGAPFSIVYNYCAAMLRAIGDSKRPLIFLAISGAVNVILNIIFVAIFRIGVAGVAIGTIASQAVSCAMIIFYMLRTDECVNLSLREIRIHRKKLIRVLALGIPSGVQSTLFSFANTSIQASINTFGSTVMAASSASANLEGMVYVVNHALYDGTLTFVGQSVGAKKYGEIKKIVKAALGCVMLVFVIITPIIILLRKPLLGLYLPDEPEAIDEACLRLLIMTLPYFLFGFTDVGSAITKGMGRSMISMTVSLLCICVFRVVWLSTVFRFFQTPACIYMASPISWVLATAGHFICSAVIVRKEIRMQSLRDGIIANKTKEIEELSVK